MPGLFLGLGPEAALAQPVEHIIRNDGVACSSHAGGTTPKSRPPAIWRGLPNPIDFQCSVPKYRKGIRLCWKASSRSVLKRKRGATNRARSLSSICWPRGGRYNPAFHSIFVPLILIAQVEGSAASKVFG